MKFRRRNAGRNAALILVLAAAVLAAGCSLTRPSPVKQTYLLDPALPAPVAKMQPGTVRVGTVNVAAAFRGRSFVVRDTEFRFDSDFYHEFFVPPGVMLADSTARALARAKVFSVTTRPGVVVDADWVLDGFVGTLHADAHRARLRLRHRRGQCGVEQVRLLDGRGPGQAAARGQDGRGQRQDQGGAAARVKSTECHGLRSSGGGGAPKKRLAG